MAFSLPSFNLTCYIWHFPNTPPGPHDDSAECNLAYGRRISIIYDPTPGSTTQVMTLLLPPGSDLRSEITSAGVDVVEVPAGTGRFYQVLAVDDVGKGFPNEHRFALLAPTDFFGKWPIPIP